MRSISVVGVLALASLASAQSTSLSFPGNGALDKYEGGFYANYLGAYANLHIQVLNGDIDGVNKNGYVWTAIAFRRASHYGYTNYARTWKSVDLNIAPHDWSTSGTTFSANHQSTPTLVFTGSMSFPGSVDLAALYQPKWGEFVKPGDMKFKFGKPYVRKDSRGLCADFNFKGGTMANNGAWTGYTPYYTDGIIDSNTTRTYNGGYTALIGKGSCFATGQTSYPYFVPFSRTYGPLDATTPNTMQAYFSATRLPANTSCFGVFAIDGSKWAGTGTPLGGSCENLHLNLSLPYIPWPFKTTATGTYTSSATPLSSKYNALYVGARLYAQCAYSQNGIDELSMAGRCQVRSLHTKVKCARVYQHSANAGSPIGLRYTTRVPSFYMTQ